MAGRILLWLQVVYSRPLIYVSWNKVSHNKLFIVKLHWISILECVIVSLIAQAFINLVGIWSHLRLPDTVCVSILRNLGLPCLLLCVYSRRWALGPVACGSGKYGWAVSPMDPPFSTSSALSLKRSSNYHSCFLEGPRNWTRAVILKQDLTISLLSCLSGVMRLQACADLLLIFLKKHLLVCTPTSNSLCLSPTFGAVSLNSASICLISTLAPCSVSCLLIHFADFSYGICISLTEFYCSLYLLYSDTVLVILLSNIFFHRWFISL